jgi:hypothetical protein
MLISHLKKFIFVKPMKTAGTSVEIYFQPWCVTDATSKITEVTEQIVSNAGIVGYRGWDPSNSTWYNHMPPKKILKHIDRATWDEYFKFTMVRNPWDRSVSMFYWLTGQRQIIPPDDLDLQQQFTWFLKSSGRFASDTVRYLVDDKFCHDAVIRYEHMDEDMNMICDRLSIEWQPERLGRYKSGYTSR